MIARDMWVILEQMYGQKKKTVCVYQLMKDVYALRQGDLSMADFYAALKSKWEELDYYSDDTWNCPQDQVRHVAKEWENMVFLFSAGLNDDFEGIRSQILNSEELCSIEDVYSRVEAEEQRRLVTTRKKGEHISYNERSALVSRGPRIQKEIEEADVGYNEPLEDEEEEEAYEYDDEDDISLRTDLETTKGRDRRGKGIMYEGGRSGITGRKRRGTTDIRARRAQVVSRRFVLL
ncbi:hypothetical protein EJ110_NYTH56918 [Nymphaea thermarum]|nr:hypothetical protein EJ110_NYTH56918 [Nymphaea thermarum]